jgi:hypothetical protein
VHLRRVVLLFAVILGVMAIVTATAPDESDDGPPAPAAPPPEPGSRGAPERVTFHVGARGPLPEARVPRGRQAIVEVRVREPGQVALEGFGLLEPAEPGTPAVFDVFTRRPGRYEAVFTPVRGGQPARVGTLVVAG